MEYTYPDYYKKFACVGGRCKDNCCAAGWQIAIDEESLAMYEKMEGDIGVRIRNSIDWKNGLFEQFEHKCALLNEQGLCDVYCDAGEDKMCVLCQKYPRHYEEYENLREISLSVSCPEAARILLTKKDTAGFYTEEDETEEEYEDFDYLMFTKLLEIRKLLFEVVQNREAALEYRMVQLLELSHGIQRKIDRDKIFEIDMLLEEYRRKSKVKSKYNNSTIRKLAKYRDRNNDRRRYMSEMMSRLHKLETLKEDWTCFVRECEELLYAGLSGEEYERLCREFDRYYGERRTEYEQLLVYFIFTYFCGSVYDYEPESKVKFGLAAVLLIRELDMAVWCRNGGRLTLEEQVEIVHRYSKEVEHSDLNLDDMERRMLRDRAFGLRRMLVAILN